MKIYCNNPYKQESDMALLAPIDEELRLALPDLTRAERQLCSHMLSHYPVAALGSINALARAAGVSAPTVVRLVQKLGYDGYRAFQVALRGQVEAMLVSPLVKGAQNADTHEGHVLNRMVGAAVENIQITAAQIDLAAFDRAAALLADPSRRVFAIGGRITHAVADYFVTLMKVIRPDVLLLSDMSNAWPPALLDMKAGDVLLMFDIRRYENAVLQAAELAKEQGAEIILITDRWVSPAAALAAHVLPCHIEAPSAWDSNVTLMVMVEALLASVQGQTWAASEPRMRKLEDMYTRTRFFRRYR
jgi:DNA-binding MurR/RpiR family transcriptional regulator